jgi:hypothetical protein
LVGRFLLHFSSIEGELNEALRKLFELTTDSADIVCANIDFFKKMQVVRSALTDQNADAAHQTSIDKLFGKIAAINDIRTMVAHASFEANGTDGVKFTRQVAKTGLERTTPLWTESYCADFFSKMADLSNELRALAQAIAPYHPSLDFSDPRNSMYLTLLFV